MSSTDILHLMGLGISAEAASKINALISSEQDFDIGKGATFNTAGTPFTIHSSAATFNSVRDDVLRIGYNVAIGASWANPATKITSSEPSMAMTIEANYKDGSGNNLVEWNFDYTSPNGLFTERPFYWSANRGSNATYMYHQADDMELFTPLFKIKSKDAAHTHVSMTVTSNVALFRAQRLEAGTSNMTVLAGFGTPQLLVGESSGSIYQQTTNPAHYFDAYGGAANSRVWGMKATTSDLSFRMSVFNDAGTVSTDFFRVIRSGTTITRIGIPNGIANYADNAAALAGGLAAGDIYRNGSVLQIVT